MTYSRHMKLKVHELVAAGLGDEELELLVDVEGHRVTNPSLYAIGPLAHKARDLFWVRSVLEPERVVDERVQELGFCD